jgi:CheY-like chemotaxis protein
MRALVRLVLEDDGYAVLEATNAATALTNLRTSPEAMVAIFGMTQGTTLLQTAVEDPSVGRHAFVLLTATPELLTPLWRVLLTSLDVPIVAKPFALDTLLAAVADAATRVGHPNSRADGHLIPA